ncbi:MAG TPA: phenylalanine--tRNA ligase beta subunit-related protein, partial [Candidatus Paceibacterota bacterium]
MKTSRAWLQQYFAEELPSAEALADTLTFHVAEIEEVKGDLIDVNVLPDRAAYLLSHRGVAKEIATALDIPLKEDPLAQELPELPESDRLAISLDAEGKCLRYIGALVTGVEVGPSPAWLREALERVGQRSINNVVDATNYVMLNIGQPLHAFDADRL